MFRADFKDLLDYLPEVTEDKRKAHCCLRIPTIVTAYEIMRFEFVCEYYFARIKSRQEIRIYKSSADITVFAFCHKLYGETKCVCLIVTADCFYR
jgi:hypothetical protein